MLRVLRISVLLCAQWCSCAFFAHRTDSQRCKPLVLPSIGRASQQIGCFRSTRVLPVLRQYEFQRSGAQFTRQVKITTISQYSCRCACVLLLLEWPGWIVHPLFVPDHNITALHKRGSIAIHPSPEQALRSKPSRDCTIFTLVHKTRNHNVVVDVYNAARIHSLSLVAMGSTWWHVDHLNKAHSAATGPNNTASSGYNRAVQGPISEPRDYSLRLCDATLVTEAWFSPAASSLPATTPAMYDRIQRWPRPPSHHQFSEQHRSLVR